MLEVEVRGPLTDEEYSKLNDFLEKNAKKTRDFDELSVFYHSEESPHDFPVGALRIKKDDRGTKVVFKVIDNKNQEINREIELNIDDNDYNNAVELLHNLGAVNGRVVPCYRKDFDYKGMAISIKTKHMLGPHFEVEKEASTEEEAKSVREELAAFAREMGLTLWEGDDYANHRDRCYEISGGPVNVLEHLNHSSS